MRRRGFIGLISAALGPKPEVKATQPSEAPIAAPAQSPKRFAICYYPGYEYCDEGIGSTGLCTVRIMEGMPFRTYRPMYLASASDESGSVDFPSELPSGSLISVSDGELLIDGIPAQCAAALEKIQAMSSAERKRMLDEAFPDVAVYNDCAPEDE